MTGEKNPWPGKKKCALMLCFDLDGKSIWQNKIRSMPGWTGFLKGPSVGQYGPNRGADRIMNILEKYGLKATFFVPASVMKENPDVVRRMVEQGHEVAHHGLYHEDSYGDTVEEQLALLEESQQIFRDVIGKPASGFRCTGSLLPGTQKALYSDPNTLYTMFNTGKELPEMVSVDGKQTDTVYLPCRQMDDYIQTVYSFWPAIPKGLSRIAPYSDVLSNFQDEIDGLLKYHGTVGTAFHPQVSGAPGRSLILEKLICSMLENESVWIATCEEVALYWRKAHKEGK